MASRRAWMACVACAAGLTLAPPAFAADALRTDRPLTGRSGASPGTVALGYVAKRPGAFGLDRGAIDDLRLVGRDVTPDGVTHLRYQQTVRGIGAYDGGVDAAVTAAGQLVSVDADAVPEPSPTQLAPKLSAARALLLARNDAGASGPLPRPGSASGAQRRTRFAGGDVADLVLTHSGVAWRVVFEDGRARMRELVVDSSDGRVLRRASLTHDAINASAYANYPGAPGAGGTAQTIDLSPWLSTTATTLNGPYAHAYADRNNNNTAQSSEETGKNANGDWVYPLSGPGSTCAGSAPCRNQTTTQLFAFVNRFHDHLKAAPIGFDSKNFEGTDAVQAENLDGGGTNNANFSTPPPGSAPRMQMYRFDLEKDVVGSNDASIVYHEYTHGLSNRLIVNGAGSSTLTGIQGYGMGEGWSDWYALDYLVANGLMTDSATPGDLLIGAYALTAGFREKPIDCRVSDSGGKCGGGYTLGYVQGAALATQQNPNPAKEEHDVGEFWGQVLWDIRREVGSARAQALITGAMRLSPDNPTILDMRNAILAQDTATGGGDHDALWRVFAARGMGYSATSGAASTSNVTERFDLPPAPPAPEQPAAAPAVAPVSSTTPAPAAKKPAAPAVFLRFRGASTIALSRKLGGPVAVTVLPKASGRIAFYTGTRRLALRSFTTGAPGRATAKLALKRSAVRRFRRGKLRVRVVAVTGGKTFRRTVTLKLPSR